MAIHYYHLMMIQSHVKVSLCLQQIHAIVGGLNFLSEV